MVLFRSFLLQCIGSGQIANIVDQGMRFSVFFITDPDPPFFYRQNSENIC